MALINERIKQLALEAGFVPWGDESWNPGDTVDWSSRYDDELEKFAELIVQECIVQIQLTTARDPQTSAQYQQSVGHIHRIRKHFGVE